MSFDISAKPEIYFNVVRKEMIAFVPSEAKIILEVGCGDGNFAELLLLRGVTEVWGIEYEKEQAELARKRMTTVIVGDVAQRMAELPDNYFDAIICNDVLEHLIDPYTVISKLKYKLKKEGVMISSIPNIRYFRNLFDYFFKKNWDYTDSGIMDKTHFRFFTYRSIRKMFESNGYEVVKMEGINPTKSIRPFIWNLFLLGSFWDIRYLQFATIARPK
jgi:2-polyprenyl-3-methyl-5-hydroxy-6-metoxy-1,4-benzoquinol methylase